MTPMREVNPKIVRVLFTYLFHTCSLFPFSAIHWKWCRMVLESGLVQCMGHDKPHHSEQGDDRGHEGNRGSQVELVKGTEEALAEEKALGGEKPLGGRSLRIIAHDSCYI